MCVDHIAPAPLGAAGNAGVAGEVSGLVPESSPVSSPAASALDRSPTRRVAWASMVGTSLESFDFYLFAYFSAFFVGPLFFEPLGPVEHGAVLDVDQPVDDLVTQSLGLLAARTLEVTQP